MIPVSYIPIVDRHFGTFLEAMISTRESDLQEVHRKTGISRPATNSHLKGETKPTVRVRKVYSKAFELLSDDFERAYLRYLQTGEVPPIFPPEVIDPAPTFTPSKYAGDPGELLRYKLQELVREGLTADEIIDEVMRMKGKK